MTMITLAHKSYYVIRLVQGGSTMIEGQKLSISASDIPIYGIVSGTY